MVLLVLLVTWVQLDHQEPMERMDLLVQKGLGGVTALMGLLVGQANAAVLDLVDLMVHLVPTVCQVTMDQWDLAAPMDQWERLVNEDLQAPTEHRVRTEPRDPLAPPAQLASAVPREMLARTVLKVL